jgi:hypothetical protein
MLVRIESLEFLFRDSPASMRTRHYPRCAIGFPTRIKVEAHRNPGLENCGRAAVRAGVQQVSNFSVIEKTFNDCES